MTAGRLQEKNGFNYMVLSYTGTDGKRKQPWFSTGLPVKGNKRRAEQMLRDLRQKFVIPQEEPRKVQKGGLDAEMPFTDYMRYWLKIVKASIATTTYASYCFSVNKRIIPYFEKLELRLKDVKAHHIQSFYLHELDDGLKANSVIRLHANLHKAFKHAVKLDLLEGNPVDKVERPKAERYMASYYTAEEMEQLFEAARGNPLEMIIQFAAFYGLRRSEVLGLRWEAIDFTNRTLTIRHIVTSCNLDGKKTLVQADRAKTKSSLRSLPRVDHFAEQLMQRKQQQEFNREICGNCYNHQYDGYIFVDEMGNLIQPERITDGFSRLLKDHGLRHIRFHDLRHSCASLLLKQGIPMKQIQEWLGHSDISTTSNIYAHLDSASKNVSAETMEQALPLPASTPAAGWGTMSL